MNNDFRKSNSNYFEYASSFFLHFNYLDLYLLSAHGNKLSHTQIYILNDPRRFSGISYKLYAEDLKEMTNTINNTEFDFFLDNSSYANNISKETLDFINNKIINKKIKIF